MRHQWKKFAPQMPLLRRSGVSQLSPITSSRLSSISATVAERGCTGAHCETDCERQGVIETIRRHRIAMVSASNFPVGPGQGNAGFEAKSRVYLLSYDSEANFRFATSSNHVILPQTHVRCRCSSTRAGLDQERAEAIVRQMVTALTNTRRRLLQRPRCARPSWHGTPVLERSGRSSLLPAAGAKGRLQVFETRQPRTRREY
jgi:hypothetical protein